MRLSQFEIETITTLVQKYFGEDAQVFLFGSKVDDNKKGGDIDVFVKNNDNNRLTLEAKINFLVDLKSIIGDQKIDLVFDNANTRLKTNFYHSISHQQIQLQ
jgi:predicted nucleotidyltransferase